MSIAIKNFGRGSRRIGNAVSGYKRIAVVLEVTSGWGYGQVICGHVFFGNRYAGNDDDKRGTDVWSG